MKVSVSGMVEKGILGLITGVLLFMLNALWQLHTKVSDSQEATTEAIADLKGDIYAAFGTIADTEARSVNNEVRSLMNEKVHTLLLQIIAVSAGKDLTTKQIEELLKGGSLDRGSTQRRSTQRRSTQRRAAQRPEGSVPVREEILPDQQQTIQQAPVDIERYKGGKRRKFKLPDVSK